MPGFGTADVLAIRVLENHVVLAHRVNAEVVGQGSAQYAAQADFPLAPPLENDDLLLYADVWERTVTNLEDPLLSDPGLHGAETAFRQQTVAQLKWAKAGEFFDPARPDARSKVPLAGHEVLEPRWVSPSGTLVLGYDSVVSLEGGVIAKDLDGVCGFWGGGFEP